MARIKTTGRKETRIVSTTAAEPRLDTETIARALGAERVSWKDATPQQRMRMMMVATHGFVKPTGATERSGIEV